MNIEVLLGPLGALALLIYVAKVLWDAHKASDEDVVRQRDVAIEGWKAQTAATDRLAEAVERKAIDDATRRRSTDDRSGTRR